MHMDDKIEIIDFLKGKILESGITTSVSSVNIIVHTEYKGETYEIMMVTTFYEQVTLITYKIKSDTLIVNDALFKVLKDNEVIKICRDILTPFGFRINNCTKVGNKISKSGITKSNIFG